jgi:cephalosporin hydroxylase
MFQSSRAIVEEYAKKDTDIHEHLLIIFDQAVAVEPKLVVELGTRGGESTRTLAEAAKIFNADFVSVDIDDTSAVCDYPRWRFVKSDDIKFAKKFADFCRANGVSPRIDILFIDTSHKYWQTKREIKHWLPYLSSKGRVLFHDTNLKAWDNNRGVIRAIEKLVGTKFDENHNFELTFKNWRIQHFANCNGLTILSRADLLT